MEASAKADPKTIEDDDFLSIDNPPIGKPLRHKLGWIQNNAGHVEKTGEVKFGNTKYQHMQEHGLLQVLKPLFRAARVALQTGATIAEHSGNHMSIDFQLALIDLESDETMTTSYPAEGVDSSDKAAYKAMTGGMKYALQKFFLIPTEKLDEPEQGDQTTSTRQEAQAQTKTLVSPANAAKLREAAQAAVEQKHLTQNAVKARIQSQYGVDRLEQLSPQQATAFGTWLAEMVGQKAAPESSS